MGHMEVLLIGGRAGAGKTSVGWEVSALLRAGAVAHAVVEGDFMGQVHPAPPDDPDRSGITEANQTAVWGDFARLGHRRLVYTNTASVLPEATGFFTRALAPARIVRVLLTASDETVLRRLTGRERGSELERELARSARTAGVLERRAVAGTVRPERRGHGPGRRGRDGVARPGRLTPLRNRRPSRSRACARSRRRRCASSAPACPRTRRRRSP